MFKFDGVVKSSIYGVMAFRQTSGIPHVWPEPCRSTTPRNLRLAVYRTFRSLRLADLAIFS